VRKILLISHKKKRIDISSFAMYIVFGLKGGSGVWNWITKLQNPEPLVKNPRLPLYYNTFYKKPRHRLITIYQVIIHTKYAQQELEGSPYVASHGEIFIRTT